MKLDTGSAIILVSEHTFKSKWPDTNSSNKSPEVLVQIEATVKQLIIAKGNAQSLYGRD